MGNQVRFHPPNEARAGGRRSLHRPSDIAVLRGVCRLLHDEGYTIKGVQRLHREEGLRRLVNAGGEGAAPAAETPATQSSNGGRDGLYEALRDLETAKQRLDALLR